MAGVDEEIEVEVYEEAAGEDMEPENLQKRTDKKSRSDIKVTENPELKLRQRRKQIRGKITRTINRLSLSMVKRELTKRRVDREMIDFRSDYKRVLDIHAELYDCENPDLKKLDHWEAELSNDIYTFEERVEDYIARLGSKLGGEVKEQIEETISAESTEMKFPKTEESVKNNTSTDVRDCGCAIDSWIDKLKEFQETQLPSLKENISIAEALFKLEANRDMPSVKLMTFDGSALKYVEFVETFKIHIHDKPNITDDMRMVQLKMHLSGDAERSISGLGTSGLVYATALKTLKEQFGQPSRIARTFIQKLTQEGRVRSNDRHGLRFFSQDIINCLATLKRINYLSDVNTIESLRKIVKRLPDHMIPGWKNLASTLRERGEVPSLEHISKFVRQRVQAEFDPDFGDIDQGQRSERDQRDSRLNTDRRKGVNSASQEHHPDNSSNQRASFIRCYICQMGHKEFECPTFLEATVRNRVEMIKSKKLCFSCLRGNHTSKQCYTRKVCTQPGCNRTHHPLIHVEPSRVSVASSPLDRDSIMPVVRVLFRAPNGRVLEGNVLIDGGAGTTIIQKDFARRLGLQGRREHLDIAVVGGKQVEQRDSRRLTFWISSLDGGEEFEIEAHELDKTVLSVPPLNRHYLSSFTHMRDVTFNHKSGEIDLILGVQYSHLHAEQEVREGLPYEPVAKKTRLGWCVIGADKSEVRTVASVSFVQEVNIQRLYDLETLGVQSPNCSCPKSDMSSEERKAYELLDSSCRKENNRYVIGVPWKRDITELPNNYNMAEKRLVSLERSLLKNPEKAELYSSAMEQYEVNGWSESVQEDAEGPIYYLPHHGVYRPEKKSTPLRVVFDPASTWQGMSLNSYMHKGPSLLGSLFSTLLRFRERPVAFVGDISKMCLQIRLMDRDTQVHRYLWRNLDVSREPVVYRMLRVTFGDKASPDMANFVMLRLADEFQMKYPEASMILRDDRYMDDILTSCDSQGEATDMMKNLDSILASGSFRIKEWICSTSETSAVDVPDASQSDVKTLGMFWNCHADSFCFKVERIAMEEYTRRTILSQIAKLYDPLGLATVVTIRSRIAMQELWRLKDYDWDDHLPKEVCEQWRDIFEDLEMLNEVQFERSLKPEDGHGTPELHVFADASVKAYGSCAYILWQTSSKPSVRLVSAKARVAPLRQSTIPRLELMAALMSSRLARTIHDNLRIKPEVYLWSDSQIVLHWLKSESRTKRPFVGVRVAEIQSEWERERWSYIASKENPADDLSRGIRADQIKDRWFHGPEFLRMPKSEWPEQIVIERPKIDTEEKRETCCASVRVERGQPFIDCESFSDRKRLIRVTAYCLRFVNNLRYRHVEVLQRKDDCLQPEEMKEAENYWLKCAQDSMKDWKESCVELSPFMKEGIVRVGGRLGRSTLTYDEAHPVLLPASSYISKLVLRHAHDSTWHAGTERTLSESRRKYWVVRGRNAVKGLIKDCVLCRRQRSPPHTTYMADLPPERLKVFSPPYTTTGIDLFGPFLLRYGRNKSVKAWGALFTCATMRAIHLEIVESLSTDSFLHALRRFVAHHGWPATIITDNGTSFVGTRGEIRRLLVDDRKRIQDFAVTHQVRWIFTTPVSPHQGGIYESLIKQTKRAIHVAIGQQTLTWNEMSTVFAEVECLINSRPLGFCSNDPNDFRPLTPNHFMLGRASAEIPQGPFEEMSNLTRRFQFVQTLMSHFWTVFQRQYLPTLMQRSKWRNMGRQIREGDVVLVVDYNLPRGRWCLGRVTETYPGIDGVVRNVGLKTQYGQYKRSVQKCIVLLENN